MEAGYHRDNMSSSGCIKQRIEELEKKLNFLRLCNCRRSSIPSALYTNETELISEILSLKEMLGKKKQNEIAYDYYS